MERRADAESMREGEEAVKVVVVWGSQMSRILKKREKEHKTVQGLKVVGITNTKGKMGEEKISHTLRELESEVLSQNGSAG